MSVFDNLFNIIVIWCQLIQTKMTVKIAEYQALIEEVKEPKGGKSLAIGFTIPNEEEECEDD